MSGRLNRLDHFLMEEWS